MEETTERPVTQDIQTGTNGTTDKAEETRIQGHSTLSGRMRGTLIIEPQASVEGNLRASRIIVFGEVNGRLDAYDRLLIKSTAKINGSIKARYLHIEDGADCNFKVEVNRALAISEEEDLSSLTSLKFALRQQKYFNLLMGNMPAQQPLQAVKKAE